MSSGIKKFVDYTSLTAFDLNEYLMNQTVMVFASSAARTTAFSTAGVTITEGMVTYLLDVDQLNVWNGSAWLRCVNLDSANRVTFPASATFVSETATGRGVGIAADSGNASSVLQFTNNAISSQWGSIVAKSTNNITINATTVTTPSQPCFLVYTGGYNHPSGWVDVSLLGGSAVVTYNVGSGWSASTGLFTAPVDGYYLFYMGGWGAYNGAGNRYGLAFHINTTLGGDWAYLSGANTSAVDSPLAMSPVIRYMQAGWYMRTCLFMSVGMQLGTSSHKFYYGGYLLG